MNKMSQQIDAVTLITDKDEVTFDPSALKTLNFKEQRLENLFGKISESGTVRHLNDTEIIRNREGGAWDSQLARRCLSAEETLNEVLQQIDDITFSNNTEGATAETDKGIVSGKEIIRDINSGMSGLQLMAKYGLSARQLKKTIEIVLKQQVRISAAFAEDVRCGLTTPELMKKYQLSESRLRKAYRQLLIDGSLRPTDIKDLNASFNRPAPFQHERRETLRRTPEVPISVYDSSSNGAKGTIKDISEKGLAVRGISGVVGESKTLSVLGDDFGLVDPFELEVECRWAGIEPSAALQVAGFKITMISELNLRKLQELIEFVDQINRVTP